MGRRCLLTKERTEKICEGIKKGLTYDMCAKYAGVSPSAFYRWLRKGREGKEKKFTDFVSRLEQAEATGAAYHLDNITKASAEDWKASSWILERRHNYTRYNSIQSQMQEKQQVTTDPNEIIKEQLKELTAAGNKALAMGSFQAYARLVSQRISVAMQLKAIEAETAEELDNTSDEQLLYEISTMILNMPPVLRQRLETQLTTLSGSNVVTLKR